MLFGTSGIRGIYGKDITLSLAKKVGFAFSDGPVAIAHDSRRSSEALTHAVISGILSSGSDVVFLGEVPTPTLAHYTYEHKIRGIMVTASHNPAEYNGFKLYYNGKEINREMELKVESKLSEFSEKGSGSLYRDSNALDSHMNFILKKVDVGIIKERSPLVVVDCNGVASRITPYILEKAGCKVISLNCGGKDFYRPSEPIEENLSLLKKVVEKSGADIGIAHDGDGDRAVFLTSEEMPGLDEQLAMMCEYELEKRKGKVVTTVESSLLVKEVIEKKGGSVELVRVGSRDVAEAVLSSNAIFGGEPCGEYIFPNALMSPDGILTALKFVELYAAGKVKNYPKYPVERRKYHSKNKEKVVEKIKEELREWGNVNEIDGIRVDFEDGFVLVRASGTEPIVRLTVQFKNEEKAKKIAEEVESIIKRLV